jgi:hypothetical protein
MQGKHMVKRVRVVTCISSSGKDITIIASRGEANPKAQMR